MNFKSFPTPFIFIIFLLPSLISSQACKKSCGGLTIRYPFGTGPGCGDPRFQKYITFDNDQQKLILTTHSGCYKIVDIDYNNQILYIQDPSMSTCSSTHTSQGFGLDWDAPFSFAEDNVFVLLDCSTNSSPLYTTPQATSITNNSMAPLCDNQGTPICSYLYSCPAITTLNRPTSTCCVYTPIDLGPSFEMDLQRLQCTSYTSFYSFNGHESNPEDWKYGIALKYRFNVKNDYPSNCAGCERTNGACGYTGTFNSFFCSCPGGVNTTSNCYFISSLSHEVQNLPRNIRIWMIASLAWFLIRTISKSCVD